MPDLAYTPYMLLAQNITMFILNLLTIGLLSPILYSKIKLLKNAEISPPFLLYLVTVVIMAFINTIKSGYAICVWWNGVNDPLIIYITSIAGLIFLPVVSLAVFFLVLHRTLIITRFITHSKIHQWLLILSFVVMFTLSTVTLINYIIVWQGIEKPAPNNCVTVDCVTRSGNGTNLSIWAKLITGFLNVMICIWFYFGFRNTQRQFAANQQSLDKINKKKTNKLTLLTIMLEIILSFLPAFVDLILRRVSILFVLRSQQKRVLQCRKNNEQPITNLNTFQTINFSLSQYLGIYATLCGSIECFFVAIIYSKTLKKMKVSTSVKITTANFRSAKNDVSKVTH